MASSENDDLNKPSVSVSNLEKRFESLMASPGTWTSSFANDRYGLSENRTNQETESFTVEEEIVRVAFEKEVNDALDFELYFGRNSRGTTGLFVRNVQAQSFIAEKVKPEDQLIKINDHDVQILDSNQVNIILKPLFGTVTLEFRRIEHREETNISQEQQSSHLANREFPESRVSPPLMQEEVEDQQSELKPSEYFRKKKTKGKEKKRLKPLFMLKKGKRKEKPPSRFPSNSEIQRLQQENFDKNNQIQQLQQENTMKNNEIQRLQQENTNKNSEMQQLRKDNANKNNEIQHLQQKNTDKNNEIQELQQENTDKNNEIQGLRQENTDKNNDNQQICRMYSKKVDDIQQLQQDNTDKKNEIQQLQQENTDKNKSIQQFCRMYSKKADDIQQLQQDNTDKNNEIQQLRQENTNKDNYIQRLQQENIDKNNEIQQLQQENDNLKKQLQENISSGLITESGSIVVSNEVLGRGAWGAVYKGDFYGTKVAVKKFHEIILSPYNSRILQREINIASQCRHPNLLQFICASTNDQDRLLIVTELMDMDLRTLLGQRARERLQLSNQEVKSISLDVALGLNYLHSKKPSPIIHRDVSSANVLLWIENGGVRRAKISDYGAANFLEAINTPCPGAAFYAAPEASQAQHDPKIDVFSYGVLVCEMSTRELPHPEDREYQMNRIPKADIKELVKDCTSEDPRTRPTMQDVIGFWQHMK